LAAFNPLGKFVFLNLFHCSSSALDKHQFNSQTYCNILFGWNWYDFPMPYILAQLADQVVGFALAGVAMAKMLK